MTSHGIMAGAALTTAVAAAAGAYVVRGSTAVPAAIWASVAAISLALEGLAADAGFLGDPASRAAARVVSASLSVCPAMSVLGAKRPQHGVWQFIVATLACVLSMPAVTAVLVRPGSLPDLHLIERCFLPLLVTVGWLNYVATRRALAVSLVSSGQLALMWAILPGGGGGQPLSPVLEAVAAVFVAAGACLAPLQAAAWPVTRRNGVSSADGINGPVLALRETLGAAWTLRIAERFNAVAAERGWPFKLGFAGLVAGATPGDGRDFTEAKRCVRSLLRRFVSSAWLDRHGGL